jgi:hypothetical protein
LNANITKLAEPFPPKNNETCQVRNVATRDR